MLASELSVVAQIDWRVETVGKGSTPDWNSIWCERRRQCRPIAGNYFQYTSRKNQRSADNLGPAKRLIRK